MVLAIPSEYLRLVDENVAKKQGKRDVNSSQTFTIDPANQIGMPQSPQNQSIPQQNIMRQDNGIVPNMQTNLNSSLNTSGTHLQQSITSQNQEAIQQVLGVSYSGISKEDNLPSSPKDKEIFNQAHAQMDSERKIPTNSNNGGGSIGLIQGNEDYGFTYQKKEDGLTNTQNTDKLHLMKYSAITSQILTKKIFYATKIFFAKKNFSPKRNF